MSTRVLRWGRRLAAVAAGALCLAAVAGVAASTLVARAGERAITMQTGSMRPVINPGDIAVVAPVAPAWIRAGDVITFQEPGGGVAMVTHRVVDIEPSAAGVSFRTRGDANPAIDPWVVHYTSTAWRVVHVVPHLGGWLDAAQGTGGRVAGGALLFLVVFALLSAPARGSRGRVAAAAT